MKAEERLNAKTVALGRRVKMLMGHLGYNQHELAGHAGLSDSRVKAVLGGENVTLITICKLEAALGTDLLVVTADMENLYPRLT